MGGGTLVLTGINTYTGGTAINSGTTLQLGNGVTGGNITGNVSDNGTLALDPVNSITLGGVISGSGNLVQLGSGTVIITGANAYTGGTDHQCWNFADWERLQRLAASAGM